MNNTKRSSIYVSFIFSAIIYIVIIIFLFFFFNTYPNNIFRNLAFFGGAGGLGRGRGLSRKNRFLDRLTRR